MTFSNFARKIPFGRFWPILFGQKMAIFGQKSTFRPISQNLLIGSSWFCIFKHYLESIYETTQWKFRGKSRLGRFGPFWVKNTLHVVTKWCFRRFLANFFQSVDVVWSIFVTWIIFIVYLWVNEFEILPKFFWLKNGHFLPKISVSVNISKSGRGIFLVSHI